MSIAVFNIQHYDNNELGVHLVIPSGKNIIQWILTRISSPTEGSLSDSATGMLTVDGKERRRVTNGKQGPSGGLSKKSSSTSKLSDTGRTGVFLS